MERLRFDLSREPLSAQERAGFDADLDRLGLDAAVWDVLEATLTTGSTFSTPLLLRAERCGTLMGAALVVECRRQACCITRNAPLERTLDALNPPSFMWLRVGAGIDAYANPGFVADGDRDALLAASKGLRKKVRKFGNKGGRVEVATGPMPKAELAIVLRWLGSMDPEVRLTFQDLYPSIVGAVSRLPGTVHVLAYLDDVFVGYHSFFHSGERLVCLSGVFDPDRASNYHAYENVMLETVRYASDIGVARIDFGPIVNPTKAKLMTRFEPSALRYVSRLPVFRRAMRRSVTRSRIGPARLAGFIGLGGRGDASGDVAA